MSLPTGHGWSPSWARRALPAALLALATALAACGDADANPPTSPALVLLRNQLRYQVNLAVSRVRQPNDTTLAITLVEGGRRWLDSAQRDTLARRAAERSVRFWPDPTLRRVQVVIERQSRLGPFVIGRGSAAYSFDAAVIAPPLPLAPDSSGLPPRLRGG